MKKLILIFILMCNTALCQDLTRSTLWQPSSRALLDSDALDTLIEEYMESKHIPGLAAVVLKNGDFLWKGAYGWADVANRIPVTENTLFMLASISKTITATALMQLYDQGLFQLDNPINNDLPFTVNVPSWPNVDITYRMLYTHSSAIRDNWGIMPYYPGDSPIPLGQYCYDYLSPNGSLYNPNKNFYTWKPGTNDGYCNVAVGLMGHLVDVLTGVSLEDHCQQNIFKPLGMNETSYFLANLNINNIALPYYWTPNGYKSYGHYGYSDYPSGQIRTSATQLGLFLNAFMRNSLVVDDGGQVRIIHHKTAQLMLTPQNPGVNPNQGLIWWRMNKGGRTLWGHGGGDQGVTTEMYYCLEENSGVVILTNGESYVYPVLNALFNYAEQG